MKKGNEQKFRPVHFGAGRAYDSWGRPARYWMGSIVYAWNPYKKMFHLWTEQTLGTGAAENSWETESYAESVNETLGYFRELQEHYKEVYGG